MYTQTQMHSYVNRLERTMQYYFRAIATGTAMVVPLFGKATNKFRHILAHDVAIWLNAHYSTKTLYVSGTYSVGRYHIFIFTSSSYTVLQTQSGIWHSTVFDQASR